MMRDKCIMLLIMVSVSIFSQNTAISNETLNMALVNLKPGAGVNEGESELISDRLRSELFKTGKVNVMERDQMQEILKEQGFQQSGACTDEACLVQIGQVLGVQCIVVGSLGKLGSMFMVNVRTIDVQTSKIINVVSVDVKGEIEDLVGHLQGIALQLVNGSGDAPPDKASSIVVDKENIVVPKEDTVIQTMPDTTPIIETVPEERVDIGSDTNRNKNRAGVSFVLEVGGKIKHYIDDELYERIVLSDSIGDVIEVFDQEYFSIEMSSLVNLQARFQIKAGPFLNIAVGPGFMAATESYTSNGVLNNNDEVCNSDNSCTRSSSLLLKAPAFFLRTLFSADR